MVQKETIGKRFKIFRKSIDKTQKELSVESKMSQANIAKIEKGEVFPNFELLAFLYENYNLNIFWLITGDGEIYTQPTNYGEYTQDMEELLYYLDNFPQVRYAILKYFLVYKYKNKDSLPPFEQNKNITNLFEVYDEFSGKNKGDE